MPSITYIDHEGTERTVEANVGETVMEAAVKNGVPGIDGDCGGACACATCHVYVDDEFMDRLESPNDIEESMLECANNLRSTSRLSCQIDINDALSGLRVATPENQG